MNNKPTKQGNSKETKKAEPENGVRLIGWLCVFLEHLESHIYNFIFLKDFGYHPFVAYLENLLVQLKSAMCFVRPSEVRSGFYMNNQRLPRELLEHKTYQYQSVEFSYNPKLSPSQIEVANVYENELRNLCHQIFGIALHNTRATDLSHFDGSQILRQLYLMNQLNHKWALNVFYEPSMLKTVDIWHLV